MELYLMVTVIERRQLPRVVSLDQEHGVLTSIISLGRGSFTGERAGYLLGQSEKAVCFALVTTGAIFQSSSTTMMVLVLE